MAGIDLIASERERQVAEEGWSADHDDTQTHGELAKAAAVYAMPWNGSWKQVTWPWEPRSIRHTWGTREGRIRELTKAGALIAAEIDRLERLWEARLLETAVAEEPPHAS
jgi:hypothetical protein